MGVFHVFKIVQMVPNCATHHIYWLLFGVMKEWKKKKLTVEVVKYWKPLTCVYI